MKSLLGKLGVILFIITLNIFAYSVSFSEDVELNGLKGIKGIQIEVKNIVPQNFSAEVNEEAIKTATFIMLKSKIPNLEIEQNFEPILNIYICLFDLQKGFEKEHKVNVRGYKGTVRVTLSRLTFLADRKTFIGMKPVWENTAIIHGPQYPHDHVKNVLDDILNNFARDYFLAEKLEKAK